MPGNFLIDSGHNSEDYNRSPVVPEYCEGRQMWILSCYLAEELKAMGHNVTSTKERVNQAVTVTQRGAMARGHDLAVSEHSNAGGNGKADRPVGIHFVDDDCGEIDALSKELAKRLARVCADVIGTRQPAQIYDKLSSRDRDFNGKKDDDYYGFLFAAHEAEVPAIILENGFHDHERTARWLLDDGNLRKLAKAQAVEIDAFYREYLSNQNEVTDVNFPVLRPGDKNSSVVFLQSALHGYGYYAGALDGSYGPKTTAAVTEFQNANNLTPDGKAGPKTMEKLVSGNVVIREIPAPEPTIIEKEVPVVPKTYNTIDDLPEYAQPTIAKLMTKGFLKGREANSLDLSEDMVRMFVILDRAHLFDS